MSGHLCLKWNNHSSAFLKSFGKIQMKEKYCDSTIVCQGKYFPVHRIILSTCSAYFDEIFQRIQCQHPYIVFKDIEPKEMELLLNYMYQGEVNVVQEMLPSLIKAAEALRIKGLAEPDDIPTSKDCSGKKRSNAGICSDSNPPPKRRLEEGRRNSNSTQPENTIHGYSGTSHETKTSENLKSLSSIDQHLQDPEVKEIKEEPSESVYFDDGIPLYTDYGAESGDSTVSFQSGSQTKNEGASAEYASQGGASHYFKEEEVVTSDSFGEQSATWNEFSSVDAAESLATPEVTPDGTLAMNERLKEARSHGSSHMESSANGERKKNISRWMFKRTSLGYYCPHCNYKSQFSSNVVTHMRHKHTKERPYSCSVCPSRFTQKINLDRHTRIHTGEKPFQCLVCFIKFKHMSSLKTHLAKGTCKQK